MDSPSNPEAAIPPTLIRKALEFHTLIGISEHETRETVLTTLVETGFSDDSSQRTMDSLLDKVRTDPDDAINGFEKKGESEAVLSRALLHTLASARGQTSRANSLLESLSEKEFTPEHQQDITEALEAALHGLPVELVLSLRTIQTKPDESAVRRVLEFLKESQSQPNGAMSGKKVLQKQAVIDNLLRTLPTAPANDQRSMIHLVCLALDRPNDEELKSSLEAMVATLSTLQTNLDFPTLLEAIKDPLPASKIVDAFYGYLADPVQADQMLSTSRWMGLGVLMEVALRHGSLRKQIVETYFRLLRWGYESKLSPLNLTRLKRKFVEELVSLMTLDSDTANLVMNWTTSRASSSLDAELRTHFLNEFLLSTNLPALPLPVLRVVGQNLDKIRELDPSPQAFSNLLSRSGLSKPLKTLASENIDWKATLASMVEDGTLDKATVQAL